MCFAFGIFHLANAFINALGLLHSFCRPRLCKISIIDHQLVTTDGAVGMKGSEKQSEQSKKDYAVGRQGHIRRRNMGSTETISFVAYHLYKT